MPHRKLPSAEPIDAPSVLVPGDTRFPAHPCIRRCATDDHSQLKALCVPTQTQQLPAGHVTVHLLVVKHERGGIDRDWNIEGASEPDGAFLIPIAGVLLETLAPSLRGLHPVATAHA